MFLQLMRLVQQFRCTEKRLKTRRMHPAVARPSEELFDFEIQQLDDHAEEGIYTV
jgi:hypothetical protein